MTRRQPTQGRDENIRNRRLHEGSCGQHSSSSEMANLLHSYLLRHCLSFNYLPTVWAAVEDQREQRMAAVFFSSVPLCALMKSLAATALIIRLNQTLTVLWRDDAERRKKIFILSSTSYSRSLVAKKMWDLLLFRYYNPEASFALFCKKEGGGDPLPSPSLGFSIARATETSLQPQGCSIVSAMKEPCSSSMMSPCQPLSL